MHTSRSPLDTNRKHCGATARAYHSGAVAGGGHQPCSDPAVVRCQKVDPHPCRRVRVGLPARRAGRVAMAAVLACGDGAVLSHESAAALWGWRRWPRVPEVTATGPRRRTGIRSHTTRSLPRADVTRQLGVPVTSPERTIRKIESRLTRKQFRHLGAAARDAGAGGRAAEPDPRASRARAQASRQLSSPRATARHASHRGHGGFHG